MNNQCCEKCKGVVCCLPDCPCHQPPKWRENIHNSILSVMYPKKDMNGKFLMQLPPVITNAIDAAYVAGLDDGKKEENKEWREGRRCEICGVEINYNSPSGMCTDCYANG